MNLASMIGVSASTLKLVASLLTVALSTSTPAAAALAEAAVAVSFDIAVVVGSDRLIACCLLVFLLLLAPKMRILPMNLSTLLDWRPDNNKNKETKR